MNPELTGNYAIFYNAYLPILANCIDTDTDYAYTKANCVNIQDLAHKIVIGLVSGRASKDGKAIKLTCKQLGINHTYKAIREFICTPLNEVTQNGN